MKLNYTDKEFPTGLENNLNEVESTLEKRVAVLERQMQIIIDWTKNFKSGK